MGCISSKLHCARSLCNFSGSPKSISEFVDSDLPNHIVSLTSSTYGVLSLDPPKNMEEASSTTKVSRRFSHSIMISTSRNLSLNDPSPEIINWTLGEDFEDASKNAGKISHSPRKKSSIHVALFTPSPKIHGKFFGKENSCPRKATPLTDPNRVLKPLIFSEKKQLKSPKSSCKSNKSSSRRSLSPMFDPELVSFFERELHEESEKSKRILPTTTTNLKEEEEVGSFLRSFEEKCPYGGEKVAVLYTTTLRGIRKTFDECNVVRSVIASYDVCVIERDISMDLGFREEMRMLMGSKDARPPVLFAKGRMVGGAAEVMRLEEEGKLGLLLEGIPKAVRSCEDCGGLRFVLCIVCNGSCKVLVQGEKKMTKCGECNENGLVHCASCSKIA